jgi:predicted Rossmann fold nucleotide-binding protein DprA/Smf involved in DNA uptake
MKRKIGIVGSREYSNKRKIKDTIFQLKNKFGEDVEIVSGGAPDGADRFAKKYALDFELRYKEFNPSHTVMNLYSACNEAYYGKKYSPRHFFHRNKLLAKYVDYVIAFIPRGIESRGTLHTIKEAHKLNKKIVVIS